MPILFFGKNRYSNVSLTVINRIPQQHLKNLAATAPFFCLYYNVRNFVWMRSIFFNSLIFLYTFVDISFEWNRIFFSRNDENWSCVFAWWITWWRKKKSHIFAPGGAWKGSNQLVKIKINQCHVTNLIDCISLVYNILLFHVMLTN